MQSKTSSIIVLFIIVSSFLLASCKKEKPNIGIKEDKSMVMYGTQSLDYEVIKTNAKWIARALPDLAQDVAFKTEMYNYLMSVDEWTRTNREIQDGLPNQPQGFDYKDEIYSSIKSNFANNDFDTSLFYRFHMEDCVFKFDVYCEDCDDVDVNLPHVVITQWEEDNAPDNYMGYFWDNTTNALDSVLIDDDDLDLYYLWVFGLTRECNWLNRRKGKGGWETCNNNGICEPWLGEDLNCPDCINANIPGMKTLYLHSITPINDVKDRNSGSGPDSYFQEGWFSNNYEIGFNYVILDNSSSIKDASYWFRAYYVGGVPDNLNSIYVNENGDNISIGNKSLGTYTVNFDHPSVGLDILSSRGRNCEVLKTKIKKNNSQKHNKGPVNPLNIVYDNIMSFSFNDFTDTIEFILYEFDRWPSGYGQYNFTIPTSSPVAQTYLLPSASSPSIRQDSKKKPYTGDNAEVIPAGSNWVHNGLHIKGKPAYEMTLTLDGEMAITFAYTVN